MYYRCLAIACVLIFATSSMAQLSHEAVIGTTQYDLQSIGSSGNRIAVDSLGGIHCVWMNGHPYSQVRDIYYNYLSPAGMWLAPDTGIDISTQHYAGYPQLSIDNHNRAAAIFHTPVPGAESLFMSIDIIPGSGNFEIRSYPPNSIGADRFYFPEMTIDRAGRIHIVATESRTHSYEPMSIGYLRSEDNGFTWTQPQIIDSVTMISAVITSSPVSDKVAIVYCDPLGFISQVQNDISYFESSDGLSWDFESGKINITNYDEDTDSIWAFTDCDAVYDYNDELHIVWDARAMSSARYYYDDRLLHYGSADGTITEITRFGDSWPAEGCDFGAGNWSIAKMSIAADTNNGLYVIYTSWDSTDCSIGGYANGDLYLALSYSMGAEWIGPLNITRTHSLGCVPGDCYSENWASMPERVMSQSWGHAIISMTYILDKDAGAISQLEGAITDNFVMYRDTIVFEIGINGETEIPNNFTLDQNYPNPFNAKTTINFSLQSKKDIKLEVFNILGMKVVTLFNGQKEAGSYTVNWDASGVASGVYYYKLSTGEGSIVKQMVLVK